MAHMTPDGPDDPMWPGVSAMELMVINYHDGEGSDQDGLGRAHMTPYGPYDPIII